MKHLVLAVETQRDRGYPAEIARETAWNSKSVQQILNDLVGSGLVFAERHEREKQFRLDRDHWLRWLRPGADGEPRNDLRWQNQAPLYLGSLYVSRILDQLVSNETASEHLQSITIREAMNAKIAREIGSMTIAFERADFGFLFQGHAQKTGGDLVELFRNGVDCLTAALYGNPEVEPAV